MQPLTQGYRVGGVGVVEGQGGGEFPRTIGLGA
jgi:hypothetical protein